MSKDTSSTFTNNLVSLQLQLKSLFDDAGGEGSVHFLDALSQLSPTEQSLALQMFRKVIDRIKNGELRVSSRQEDFMKELEDTLYSDIVHSMKEASGDAPSTRRLEVLDGGRKRRLPSKEPIDLKKARETRKSPGKPLIN